MTGLRTGQVMMWNGSLWVNAEIGEGLPTYDAQVYGATPGGTVDASAGLLAAITAAAGKPVTGGGLTYGISGSFSLPASTWLQDMTLKQLTPDAAGDVRTLTSASVDAIRLVRVKVDRNGSGANGALSDDAGVYISGGAKHYFEDVEVTGDDMGTGFAIVGASNFECVRPYAHDMDYLLGADPGDDRVQGIWFQNCSKFSVADPIAHDLGGNFGGGATTRYSRGIVYGGCSDFTVHNPRSWNVDQGHDITGSDGNVRWQITGGLMQDCYTFGFKFANSARDGTIVGAAAERCGQAGFIASGPADTISVMTSDIDFIGCKSYDAGSNGAYGSAFGFRITDGGGGAAGAIRGIRFLGCKAYDRQVSPTMDVGFSNDVAANSDGRYNEAIGCVSVGHVSLPFSGMNASRCTVGLSASPTIANDTWTTLSFGTDVSDLGAMHDTGSNTDQILARRAGPYRVHATANFVGNGTGQRGIRITLNGTAVTGASVLQQTNSATEHQMQSSWTLELAAGDIIRAQVYQSSGGNLVCDNARVVVQQESY